MLTNNDEWERNVACFLDRQKDSENHDFALGYCTHILSDMYNNIAVWTPFRLKHPDVLEKGYNSQLNQENNKIDIELALTHEKREEFWRNLSKSQSVDLPGIIYADEIDRQKENILDAWYKGQSRPDISSNELVTYESAMLFIKDATDFVVSHLQKSL